MDYWEKRRDEIVAHLRIIDKLNEALDDTPWSGSNVVELMIIVGKLQEEAALLLIMVKELESYDEGEDASS